MNDVQIVEFAALGNDIWRGSQLFVDLHRDVTPAIEARKTNLIDEFSKDVAEFLQIPDKNIQHVTMGSESVCFNFVAYHAIALPRNELNELLKTAPFLRTMRAYFDAGKTHKVSSIFEDRIRLPGDDWRRALERFKRELEQKAQEDINAAFEAAQPLDGSKLPSYTISLHPARPSGANLFFASVDNPTPAEKERRREVLGLGELPRLWDLYHQLVTGQAPITSALHTTRGTMADTSLTPTAKSIGPMDDVGFSGPSKLIPSWMSKWDTDSDECSSGTEGTPIRSRRMLQASKP